MNHIVTRAIFLSRTNYGEADRILTVLTPDHGKLRLMARGVRKSKSKLAGGIELFSVSDITFIRGKADIGTLVSARLDVHYGEIVKHIERTMLGYEIMKIIHRATEDETEEYYFTVLQSCMEALNDTLISDQLIRVWYMAQLIKLAGHSPNLQTDISGNRLVVSNRYLFSFDDMAFAKHSRGNFDATRIKFLRLLFSSNPPSVLAAVIDSPTLAKECNALIQGIAREYVRL